MGRYTANFATFSNEVFTAFERNGRLALDMPSQTEATLNPPGGDGRWSVVGADQVAVSFDRNGTGTVVGLRVHQAGRAFEVPREGVQVEPEIALDRLQKYVGGYRDQAGALVFDILIQNQRLAVRLPTGASLDLLPPDPDGRRATRANIGLALAFEESASGSVAAMNVHPPGAPPTRLTPAPNGSPLPPVIVSVDAQTGDVLHEQRTVAIPGVGGLPMTITYSDYRDVRGIRVPLSICGVQRAGRTHDLPSRER